MTPHHRLEAPSAARRRGDARATVAAVLAVVALAACSHSKPDYCWVEDATQKPAVDGFRIDVGDVLSIRVFNQDPMSVDRVRVREDGKISVPFLQDVEVAGQTPDELSTRLRTKLKTYVVSPVVTVTVVERMPLKVSVLGEVARPGVYEVERTAGVLHALAAAGGLTEYAHRDRIFVLRNAYWADGDPAPACIRFRYEALARGQKPAATYRLAAGDVVVVE